MIWLYWVTNLHKFLLLGCVWIRNNKSLVTNSAFIQNFILLCKYSARKRQTAIFNLMPFPKSNFHQWNNKHPVQLNTKQILYFVHWIPRMDCSFFLLDADKANEYVEYAVHTVYDWVSPKWYVKLPTLRHLIFD